MKVLGICGSPRKGNTELLLEEALKAAEKAGAKTELVLLRNLRIKHCDGCVTCESGDTAGKCRINDEMQGIYKRMEAADAIIIGSPNYYNNVTGLLKDFIDRTLVYYGKNKLKGKLGGVIAVGGGTTKEVVRAIKPMFMDRGVKVVGIVEVVAGAAGKVVKDKRAIAAARGLGKEIVETLK